MLFNMQNIINRQGCQNHEINIYILFYVSTIINSQLYQKYAFKNQIFRALLMQNMSIFVMVVTEAGCQI